MMLAHIDSALLSSNLYKLRQEARLCQAELARRTNGVVSSAWISQLERGGIQSPRYEKVLAVARALGVPVERLIGEDSARRSDKNEVRLSLPPGVMLNERQLAVLQSIMESLARELCTKNEEPKNGG